MSRVNKKLHAATAWSGMTALAIVFLSFSGKVKAVDDSMPAPDLSADPIGLGDEAAKALWESTPSDGAAAEGEDQTALSGTEEILNPPDEYHYAAFGKPDPFVKPIAPPPESVRTTRDGDTEQSNDPNKPKDSYEIPLVSALQVSLNLLRVKGIWEVGGGERKALIGVIGSSPTSALQGLITKVGDPIGLSGKIIKIEENAVITRQYRLREDGSREFEDIALTLGTTIPGNNANAPEKQRKGKVILNPGKSPVVKFDDEPLVPAPVSNPTTPATGASQLPTNGQAAPVPVKR